MKFNFSIFLLIAAMAVSCTKEDDLEPYLDDFTGAQQFVSKIVPGETGYWLVTRNALEKNLNYFQNINLVDGLTYFDDTKSVGKGNIGYILDVEIYNNTLVASTSNKILAYNQSLQASVLKDASANESFKLLDKDTHGKVWVLSNKSIFSLNGDVISFPNNIQAIDFEAAKDNSFWIASSDTVYQVKMLGSIKIPVAMIAGNQNSPTIYGLKIDKNSNIWVNTSAKLYKYGDNKWSNEKVGTFTADNFKTIPFMDTDSNGNLWLGEKHYQAFTTLHLYNGSLWTSYKLEPKIDTWINDIEVTPTGEVWIASDTGIRKLMIN